MTAGVHKDMVAGKACLTVRGAMAIFLLKLKSVMIIFLHCYDTIHRQQRETIVLSPNYYNVNNKKIL